MTDVTSSVLESNTLTPGQKKNAHDDFLLMSSHSTIFVPHLEFSLLILTGILSMRIPVSPGNESVSNLRKTKAKSSITWFKVV